jgi:hypothetical protein
MNAQTLDRQWVRNGLGLVALLIVLSPVFAWAASTVGYAEPLEHAIAAADIVGSGPTLGGLLPGYALPWVGPYVGTLLSAALGTTLVLVVTLGLGHHLSSSDTN